MSNQKPSTKWAGKQVFTTGEVAEICKVCQQTIIRCFDSGRLHGFRVPVSNHRRIPRADLIRFMKAYEIPIDALEPGKVIVCGKSPVFNALSRAGNGSLITHCGSVFELGIEVASSPSLRAIILCLDELEGVAQNQLDAIVRFSGLADGQVRLIAVARDQDRAAQWGSRSELICEDSLDACATELARQLDL